MNLPNIFEQNRQNGSTSKCFEISNLIKSSRMMPNITPNAVGGLSEIFAHVEMARRTLKWRVRKLETGPGEVPPEASQARSTLLNAKLVPRL